MPSLDWDSCANTGAAKPNTAAVTPTAITNFMD